MSTQVRHVHYCYILSLVDDDQVTYIGYTINIENRLRQHNGELRGGARFTTMHGIRKGKTWRVVALVTAPDLDHRRGLSLEWHMKYPDGGKGRHRRPRQKEERSKKAPVRCAANKVCCMVKAMVHPKFVNDEFTAWIVPELRGVLDQAMIDASHLTRCNVYDWPSASPVPHIPISDRDCEMEDVRTTDLEEGV